jgi:hypothetical protein
MNLLVPAAVLALAAGGLMVWYYIRHSSDGDDRF